MISLLLALSCTSKSPPEPALEEATTPEVTTEVGETVLGAMDREADPCVDFYRYSCGGWMDRTEIPGDEPWWVRSFSVIDQRNEELVRGMLEEAAAATDNEPGSEAEKVGAFYRACMDTEAVEAAGLEPIGQWLTAIDAADDLEDRAALVGALHTAGVDPLFSGGVYPSFDDPGTDILHLSQGGLGLPDRDFYLDEARAELRVGYVTYVATMLELLGEEPEAAAEQAEAVLAFETALAEASWPRAELRDPEKTWNKVDREGLQALDGDFPWDAFFEAAGQPELDEINVEVPDYYEAMMAAVAEAPAETFNAYLRFRVAATYAWNLPAAFGDAQYAFYGKQVLGLEKPKPRWRRCVDYTQEALGEAIGQLYVKEAFAGDSKETALELIHRIEAAFEANLDELAWMDDQTRQRALEKRQTLINKIGYPDQWRDYSGLEVGDDHLANVAAARAFEVDRQLSKVGQPTDRGEWFMAPQMVNAYYNPLYNEMVFPAGILQPPFFDADYPSAMNYGAIGMVMGHELTHGFDDSGRKFDAEGRMTQWWNDEAVEAFEEQAQCVDTLYDGYEVQESLFVNGELTLGENIADLGGLKESWGAWNAKVREEGPDPVITDQLTPEQLFFVAFAQGWCAVATPEFEQLLLTVDTHSPPRFRVNGPVSQLPAFGETFDCELGDPMMPEDTCEVW